MRYLRELYPTGRRTTMNLTWSSIRTRLERARLLQSACDQQVVIDHLAHDSRKVGPNGLFVAMRGEKTDGHLFIDKAVQNEASAVVCEVIPAEARERFPGVAFAQVSQARPALAELAAAWYSDPARELTLTGITGTNGKSTTAHMLHALLSALGGKTGLLGTIEYRCGAGPEPAPHTTPDALDLQGMLRRMADTGCSYCVMEVSSHALAQARTHGVPYAAAIFTNLSRDHLGYHATISAYAAAKKRLFDDLPPDAAAIYNADDPAGKQMVSSTAARTLSYGQSAEADIRVEILEDDLHGLRLRLDGVVEKFRLAGHFNAYNLAAAYAAARSLGFASRPIVEMLAQAAAPPGRFEKHAFADGTLVIVDYAHTPDALRNVLQTIRASKPRQSALWCLFGCGGDRDRSKRPFMGAVAERLADHVIITSDNARTEAQERINEDIRAGMQHPARAHWITDRRTAIRAAARQASLGDIVLVAGKGHERVQTIGTRSMPFDDRQEVQRAFRQRGLPTAEQPT